MVFIYAYADDDVIDNNHFRLLISFVHNFWRLNAATAKLYCYLCSDQTKVKCESKLFPSANKKP